MWYVVLITLVIDVGGLLLVYAVLRDRVRRATSAAAQIAELRDEVSRLVVELNQTTERNVALLEDRITGLSDLLAAADRKVALLQRETEKHDVGAKVYSRLVEGGARVAQAAHSNSAAESGSRAQGSGNRAHSTQASVLSEKGEFAAAARSQASLSVELSEKAGQPGKTAGSPGGPGKGVPASARQDTRERVVMLSQSGFSPSLIAARVGVPLGEVELIISLERQRMSQPVPPLDEEQI